MIKTKDVKLAYLAYSFTGGVHGSGSPTENTERARKWALEIMKKHPDIYVIVPHYCVDAILDGTVTWDMRKLKEFSKERRKMGGMLSVMLVSRCDIFILGCPPEYKYSHGVTWEWVLVHTLNATTRKDNPIKIVTIEEMLKD